MLALLSPGIIELTTKPIEIGGTLSILETTTTEQNDAGVDTFVIAEYSAQHARAQAAIAAVNQAVGLYVAVLGVLATSVAGAIAVLWAEHRTAAVLMIAGTLFLTSASGALTLVATFKARMQQTEAEQSLARLRRYFLLRCKALHAHVDGPIHDDWPTPYTHPGRSSTVIGWLTIIVVSAVALGAATLLGMSELLGGYAAYAFIGGVSSSVLLGGLLAQWLFARLALKRRVYRPRFPRSEYDQLGAA